MDSQITNQISCKIPINIWNGIKDIANQKGISATAIAIQSFKRTLSYFEKERMAKSIKVGDKVTVTKTSGQIFARFTVCSEKGHLGIIINNHSKEFLSLSGFKKVTFEEKI